jgi:type IV secretory pathway VirB10-like protein
MTEDHGVRQQVSSIDALHALAGLTIKRACAVSAVLVISLGCVAQDQPVTTSQANSQEQQQAGSPSQKAMVSVPAGTKIALVLTNPISSKTVHRGDTIYTQVTAPVPFDNEVAIPAGTFVQGKLDKLSRNGTRAVMLMQSAAVVFPDGYVAQIAKP